MVKFDFGGHHYRVWSNGNIEYKRMSSWTPSGFGSIESARNYVRNYGDKQTLDFLTAYDKANKKHPVDVF